MKKKPEISREYFREIIGIMLDQYGYDFSDYSVASLSRRFERFISMNEYDLDKFRADLTEKPEVFSKFFHSLTVNVTEMFRDPPFYRELTTRVLPGLSSYPIIKIWHAGCASGEEPFSLAILLHEHQLLDRARIYATDLNPMNLDKAEKGILPASAMQDYTRNYISAGGQKQFSDYYTARYDHVMIDPAIRRNIIFSQHNLVTDHAFNEFQLICCRNVLIYFNKDLQQRVFRLFDNSLAPLGYITLGSKESMLFSDLKDRYETISLNNKIYRRKT